MTQWQSYLPVIALALAGTFSLIAAVAALRWRAVPGARPLAICSLATALWSFGYAFELSASTLPTALGWATLQYVGIVIVPGSWLVFTARYTHRDTWLSRQIVLLLCILPTITVLAVATNTFHRLFWVSYTLIPQGGRMLLDVEHGPLFWVHASYSYICLLTGSVYLLRMISASPALYRGRLGALLVALAAPWVGNALYLLNLSPFGALDLTPLAFSVSFIAITWSIIRLRLFNLIPLARGAVIEQMSDSVAVIDAFDHVIDMNTAALRSLGRARHDVIGKPARQVFARWPEPLDRYRQMLHVDEELQLQEDDGAHWYNVRISPLMDDQGHMRGRLVVSRDITLEKQALAALVAAKEAAEAASKAKSAFLANMSHELRTPLSTVLGYAQLMRMELDGGAHDKLPTYLASVELAGDHLLRLINNLLQIARIEATGVDLEIETIAVTELIAEVVTMVRPLVDRKANTLRVTHDDVLSEITTDRVKLRQILFNLLDNASKFTEQGEISLQVQREPGMEQDWLTFVVSDTGVGISDEELPLLFNVFTEPDVLKRRRFGGTGIGLALSRQLCHQLGGEIIAGPPSTKGSTFTVRLPSTFGVHAQVADGERVTI
jgi:PAS domain S-box-containing protein